MLLLILALAYLPAITGFTIPDQENWKCDDSVNFVDGISYNQVSSFASLSFLTLVDNTLINHPKKRHRFPNTPVADLLDRWMHARRLWHHGLRCQPRVCSLSCPFPFYRRRNLLLPIFVLLRGGNGEHWPYIFHIL